MNAGKRALSPRVPGPEYSKTRVLKTGFQRKTLAALRRRASIRTSRLSVNTRHCALRRCTIFTAVTSSGLGILLELPMVANQNIRDLNRTACAHQAIQTKSRINCSIVRLVSPNNFSGARGFVCRHIQTRDSSMS